MWSFNMELSAFFALCNLNDALIDRANNMLYFNASFGGDCLSIRNGAMKEDFRV